MGDLGDQSEYGREYTEKLSREGRQINSADIEEFAQAAFTGVLRAIEAREFRPPVDRNDSSLPPWGPILWGIWYDPSSWLGRPIDPRELPPNLPPRPGA